MITFIFLLLAVVVHAQYRAGEACVEKYYNEVGVCEISSKCKSALNDYRQRNIQPTFCNYSPDNPVVCCRDPPRKRISEIKCEEYSESVTQNVEFQSLATESESFTKSAPNCTYTGLELIVGGQAAIRGEFPHMAAVGWLDFDGNYVFNCGGSLISPNFVLTAGHCTHDPRTRDGAPSIVRLGEHNVDPDVNDGAEPIDRKITAIHKHPNYTPPVQYNDIALLEFNEVEFGDFIRPACLWNKFNFGDHKKAVATGWGVNDTTKETRQNELQKVSLTLMYNSFCDRKLRDLRNRKWHGFENTQMCAGELQEKKDTCQGDSGSPLQVSAKDNPCIFYVMGIVSFGRRCATNQPAIYTRVFEYLDWIEGIVWGD